MPYIFIRIIACFRGMLHTISTGETGGSAFHAPCNRFSAGLTSPYAPSQVFGRFKMHLRKPSNSRGGRTASPFGSAFLPWFPRFGDGRGLDFGRKGTPKFLSNTCDAPSGGGHTSFFLASLEKRSSGCQAGRYFFATAFLLAITLQTVAGQTVMQLIKAGDEKFAQADYYAASLYYKDALKKDEVNIDLNYKFAEASRLFNDYGGAAVAYKKVVELDKVNKYQLSLFWLGEMLRSSCVCKSDEAMKAFRRFRNRYHPKDYYSAKAQQEMEACAWVMDHQKQVDTIHIEHLGKDVNTTSSEFNAIPVYPDKIQYSSLRSISTESGDKYLVRIYNEQPNPENIYMPSGSNPALNIGNGAYSPDSRAFYFTQCEQKDKVTTRCDIYVSRYENFKWGDAQKLSINDAGATNTQPAVGYDKQGQSVLFFASNRSGGEGGLDIWVSKIKGDNTFGEPVNAGKAINTMGNEVTPFYDANNKLLFFSSDWHYGFGGYDIFKSKGEYSNWSEPVNLMQPINTAQNDLYYVLTPDNSKAYLTSNRKGSYFIEAETCCNDIYAYNTGKGIPHKRDTVAVAVVVPPVVRDTTPVIQQPPAISKEPVAEVKPEPPVVKQDTTVVAHLEQPTPPGQFINGDIKRIKQYLPLELYFHNDEPECCNLKDTTSIDYKQSYETYTGKEYEYRKEFSKGLKGRDKTDAENKINELFSKYVDKGFYDLIAFSSQLLDILKGGDKVELTIKGYCSPLHVSDYNIKLGYRRVASLRNYFFHYRDGILLPYLGSGQLVLKSVSLGKETAPKTVSDRLDDKRNSVYNPAAALERRVEIVSVEVK